MKVAMTLDLTELARELIAYSIDRGLTSRATVRRRKATRVEVRRFVLRSLAYELEGVAEERVERRIS